MRIRSVGAGLLALAALASGCGEEEPKPSGAPLTRAANAPVAERAENRAPVVERVTLSPQAPLAGQKVEARVEVDDPDGDPIRLELEWRRGGEVVRTGSHTSLVADGLAKGESIGVVVWAHDGRDRSEPAHADVVGGNQPPLLQGVYLAPHGEVVPGQVVTAEPQGRDADGDSLEYTYEWLVNGEVVRGADEASFDTSELLRGDKLQARVRVSDGEDESPLAESMTLTLANRPPKFAGLPPIATEDGSFRADLEARDPDGDRGLRYRVVEGPAGLTVDSVTGRLAWHPGAQDAGNHPVAVAVADSLGAESTLRFELTVASGAAAKTASPAKKRSDDEESEE
jgi:hypothetical protein